VLAVLALALFPVLAHAGETAGGAVYEPEVPHIETEKAETTTKSHSGSSTKHTSSNNAKAEGSAVPNGGTGKSSAESEEAESGSEGHKSGGVAGGGNGNSPKGGGTEGAGNSGKNSSAGSEDAISGQQVASKSPVETSESSGGSSPVVPILIAVAVLAAISIGVVLYRQRKSGQGPDSSVSSPNAS
jgi:cobalamin biosynthesis Mg chelatase CobN